VVVEQLGRKNFIAIGALVAMVVACMFLAAASPAQAQGPAICDEYPELPICDDGGGGDNPDGDGDTGPGGFSGGTGDGDGSLPFTGYPLTGLILLLLLLLAAGLALRGGVALRDRFARRPAS